MPRRLELAPSGGILLGASTTDWDTKGNDPELGDFETAELDTGGLLMVVETGDRDERDCEPAVEPGSNKLEITTGATNVDIAS